MSANRLTHARTRAIMAVTAGVVTLIATTAVPAAASWSEAGQGAGGRPSAIEVSSEDEAFFREQMTHYGVPERTQDRLFVKLERGQLWDADLGKAPVSVEERVVDGRNERIERFKDGSIAASSMQLPTPAPAEGQVVPMTWLGCQVILGTTYNTVTNCAADWTRGTTYMRFHVDGRIYHNGYDTITKAHTSTHRFLGGKVTGTYLTTPRKWENASSPAQAVMSMDVEVWPGLSSWRYQLVISLQANVFSHQANF